MMKNNRKLKVRVKVRVRIILFYSELAPTDPWCNILQTLLGRKKYEVECQMNNLDQKKLLVWGLKNGCSKKVENIQGECRKTCDFIVTELITNVFWGIFQLSFTERYFTKQLRLLVKVFICFMNQILTVLIRLSKQKHSPKVVLKRTCSEKFHKFHGKKPLMKSFLS